MLNNVKIGKKLTAGFLFILLLLVVVAGCGYFGLIMSGQTTTDALNTEDLQTAVAEIRENILQAQIASANGVYYRDESYNKARETNDQNIAKIVGEIREQLSPENKTNLSKLESAYVEFVRLDQDWYKKEAERQKHGSTQMENAETVLKSLDGIRDAIVTTMKSEEESKFLEGQRYISEDRVDQLTQAENCLSLMQVIRRQYFQFYSEMDAAKKSGYITQIQNDIRHLLEDLDRVGGRLTTENGKRLHTNASEALKDWRDAFNANVACLNDQTKFETDQAAKITEVETVMDGMISILRTRVTDIRNISNNTDTYMLTTIGLVTAVALLIGMALSFVLSRNITTGIGRAVGAMKTISDEGNVAFTIPALDMERKDEVGDLAQALNGILHQFQNVEGLANNLANGNWNVNTRVRGDKDTMNINLNTMLTQVNEALHEIDESVKQVTTGAGEVSAASQTLSSGAQESAASLEEITASMSEISGQTKQNAESATRARDLAQNATQAATEGQEAMQKMTGAMERITQNSSEIQRVIKVIDDIAFQTNLLALNAAVEAARAGVHGKGFAVVAEEVRNLAARSAKAAQETTELISKSGKEISNGGEVALHTSDVLNTIADQIKQTTDLIAGIAIASNEQAQGVAQITLGLQQIDQVTQQNTAAAEESASAANQMSGMATNLQKLVAKFQLRR